MSDIMNLAKPAEPPQRAAMRANITESDILLSESKIGLSFGIT